MKKTFFLLIMLAILNSCSSIDLTNKVPIGKFSVKGDIYYEELELEADGQFFLKIQEAHLIRKCTGTWKIKSKHEIILNGEDMKKLNGNDSLFYEKLNCNDLSIRFLNKNKIQKNGYFLKRVK